MLETPKAPCTNVRNRRIISKNQGDENNGQSAGKI